MFFHERAEVHARPVADWPSGPLPSVFYDPGIGTAGVIDRITGGVFGVGLSQNILDGITSSPITTMLASATASRTTSFC